MDHNELTMHYMRE